jgi:hypothetical protein
VQGLYPPTQDPDNQDEESWNCIARVLQISDDGGEVLLQGTVVLVSACSTDTAKIHRYKSLAFLAYASALVSLAALYCEHALVLYVVKQEGRRNVK